jgi:hypothetical protein
MSGQSAEGDVTPGKKRESRGRRTPALVQKGGEEENLFDCYVIMEGVMVLDGYPTFSLRWAFAGCRALLGWTQ